MAYDAGLEKLNFDKKQLAEAAVLRLALNA
jgi:hypothetical protein